MTIKSLLLGSAAVLALGTSAQAADPIAVALDTCDLLNITGLTISSESNCLKFEGEVSYEWDWDIDASTTDSDFNWELTTTATADSDFGPAMAVFTLENENSGSLNSDVDITTAYVGIGDASSTVLYAGLKGTIANTDDAAFLTAMFDFELVDTLGGAQVGGHVIQVSSSLGDGVNVGLGLEGLETSGNATLVGSVSADQDWGTAHATFAFDDLIGGGASVWGIHAGATFNASDDVTIVTAFVTDNTSAWGALVSAEASFDMFTVAAGFVTDSTTAWDFSVSGVADLDDSTTLTAGFNVDEGSNWQFGLEGEFALSDTLTATAGVTHASAGSLTTFSSELAWAPGGGFESSVGLTADSASNIALSTSFEKSFE